MLEPPTPADAGTSQGAAGQQELLSPASPDPANKGPGKGKAKAAPPPPADDGASSDSSVDSNAAGQGEPASATSGEKPARRPLTAKVRMYAARTTSSLKLM